MKTSNQWQKEVKALQGVLSKTKLQESIKWGLRCYSHNDSNIVIIQPFKACLGLMFFKGMFLKDPKKVLVNNGPNSKSAKRLEFRSVDEVKKLSSVIASYIKEAIAIEESGVQVEKKAKTVSLPAELKSIFTKKPKLKKAFESLTPGRQRAYLLHFSSAKQSETRISRIEKCAPRILSGKGLND